MAVNMGIDQLGRPVVIDDRGRRVMDHQLNESLADAKRAKEHREAVERGEIEEDPLAVKRREEHEARARREERFQEYSDAYDAKIEAEKARALKDRQRREEEEDKRDPIRAEARRQIRIDAAKRELQGGAPETVLHTDSLGQTFVIDAASLAAKRKEMEM